MRLMNEHGVVVNVPNALGEQLAGSGAWDRLGDPKPARKPAKSAAKKAAPATKPADDAGDQGDADAAGDGAQ
ncbi:head-to-tail connector protein [Mycobacterium phage Terror]|uniref:Head-to-tail connector protein n=1 Tax=Mycobacterium phage Taheera TaxID=1897549 RepID=A0A1D8EVP8_9CAUD|nr:head-to-tail connector protein [Mycobacterium phage Taheera]AOT25119.1 head-to-tail connector protein [Mycobacterium phage Taheera]AOT25179.1 head-to-tail connector protein [Mycobacterium phage Terror]